MAEENQPVTWDQVMAQSAAAPELRHHYGSDPEHYAELRGPEGEGPHPVVVLIHGGCWLHDYSQDHIRPLADAITALGYATWTVEYRRGDSAGGGWPNTFLDAAKSLDALRDVHSEHALDLQRITLLGHSAGGQLALWLAARSQLDAGHPLYSADPLPVARVLALAAIADMHEYGSSDGGCQNGARLVMGGRPEQYPDRYLAVDPLSNLPGKVNVHLIHAEADPLVPYAHSERYAQRYSDAGGVAVQHPLPSWLGHFDVLLPAGPAWQAIRDALAH